MEFKLAGLDCMDDSGDNTGDSGCGSGKTGILSKKAGKAADSVSIAGKNLLYYGPILQQPFSKIIKEVLIMRGKSPLTALLVVMVCTFTGAAEPEWKPALDREGIQVYTRSAPGCPINEFRGETTVNASMQTISAVLRDVNRQPEWMADCLQSKLLKTISADHLVVYNLLHLDWPLSNRDLLIDVIFNEDRKTKKLVLEMTVYSQDIFPVNSRYVRIRDFRATCIVEEISAGRCRVLYQNRVNPMAPVPAFIANSIVKNNPFNTLKGMKKMVLLQEYNAGGKEN